MNSRSVDSAKGYKRRDPDLAAVENAMKRAAKVRQKARQVGAGVVEWKDGHVVEKWQNTSAGE